MIFPAKSNFSEQKSLFVCYTFLTGKHAGSSTHLHTSNTTGAAREPTPCIPCWWRPCKWSSVSAKAGWCCGWLQRQRSDSQGQSDNHRATEFQGGDRWGQHTPSVIPHRKTVTPEGPSVHTGVGARPQRQEAKLPSTSFAPLCPC